jgi:predicted HAD superfamily Cof-like phosphohydrolase
MSNPFTDQEKFMVACGQTVDHFNQQQYELYKNLIREEVQELEDAESNEDALDALVDILVVTIGTIHSMGADGEGAWNEVMRSNFSKICEDGKVRKREDGKVLKPITYSPPNLEPFVKRG